MFMTKLKLATAALVAIVVLGSGAGWFAHRALADNSRGDDRRASGSGSERPGDRGSGSERPGDRGSGSERPGERGSGREDRGDLMSGKVVDVAKDAKSFAIETAGATRDDSPARTQITIGDKTTVIYHGVGTDGAKPTVGYMANVKPVEKGKDLAEAITFTAPTGVYGGRGERADLAGKIVEIARDGKGFTIETPSGRPRVDEPKRTELKFNDKTVLVYSNVGKGGAKLTEGLEVQVVLEDPTGNTPGVVYLRGTQQTSGRGEERRAADVAGKVVAVGKDEKSVTIEVAAVRGGREERPAEPAEPTKVEVKLNDTTDVAFYNVGPDATKIVEGMMVHIWLASGSKDVAGIAAFAGTVKDRWALHAGKLTAVSKDGKTITIEIPTAPPKERGEEPKPPTKMEFVISTKTRVSYNGVGSGEAKPTEGYAVQVRADEGAKEAFEITFMKGGVRGR
jgi:hypothetical protein